MAKLSQRLVFVVTSALYFRGTTASVANNDQQDLQSIFLSA